MLSKQMEKNLQNRSAIREVFEYGIELGKKIGPENVFDFSLGNPATPAPEKFKEAVVDLVQNEDSMLLNGYTDNSGYQDVRQAIAEDLNKRYGTDMDFHNIVMSVGAAGALNTVFKAILDIDDEVIFFAPYFSEYVNYVSNFYAKHVVVRPNTETFQPDLADFEAKISEKTKAVIINSPNNPSGTVYSEETIQAIAEILNRKQKEYNKEIYLISDEPYRELLYDGAKHTFVTNYYDNTFVCYSYSKSLSLPGERIGYVAFSKKMAEAGRMEVALKIATRVLGFVNAPSLIQKAVKACLEESTPLDYYAANREILYNGLLNAGFECVKPQGAFYIFLKSPIADDIAFCEKAKEFNLMLVHGTSFECPGFCRLTYCISKEKIERSIPQFEKLAQAFGLTPKK